VATAPIIQLGKIGQIATRARDLDRAVAFYRDVLGLPFLYQFGQLAFFDCAGTRLLIETPQAPEFDHPGSILYFTVADIQADWARLSAHGIDALDGPHLVAKLEAVDVWMAFFRDPEGNTLALISEVAR
jgi:catechol 2,3-dioxygenase-like lactoylglutathione lyase family enzyme